MVSVALLLIRSHSGRQLDYLCGELIEEKCIQPTFLLRHPIQLSPLVRFADRPQRDRLRALRIVLPTEHAVVCSNQAKANEEIPVLAERFELFVDRKVRGKRLRNF